MSHVPAFDYRASDNRLIIMHLIIMRPITMLTIPLIVPLITIWPARVELVDALDTVEVVAPLLDQHVIEPFFIRDRRRLLARLFK